MLGGLPWALVATLVMYLTFLATRVFHRDFTSLPLSTEGYCCEDERQADISDSRLSNFGSEGEPKLDSSEAPTIHRVIPLTKTLNRIMERIIRKFVLYIQLEDKKVLFLKDDFLNLTFYETKGGELTKNVFGTDAVVSRIDSFQRLGNAYVYENSDDVIVLLQKLRLRILKYKYDFYDEDSKLLGSSSLVFNDNSFLLNITLSTNSDDSECKIHSVSLMFIPDSNSCSLKVEGLVGTEEFYSKLKSMLDNNFRSKVICCLQQEMLPLLTKVIRQADICCYFNAKD